MFIKLIFKNIKENKYKYLLYGCAIIFLLLIGYYLFINVSLNSSIFTSSNHRKLFEGILTLLYLVAISFNAVVNALEANVRKDGLFILVFV